ncbi:ATP-dependent DNA helicase PIF1 [Golovinomyces cichoracearum]|uniref:ATP-dependent DNA helicase n=1 Tax=Golovinomyces cichoracearum TaxID=62708 RepID=A0A420IVF2_9PEZI|nr:ATP-dependent DNA helicase PIF1 [Golovinomyces cichoracearum]
MDADQIYAYNACVYGDKSVFCTGGAGSGKSFVLSKVVTRLRERYKYLPGPVAVTAFTGSAAFLVWGTTLHRFAGKGIEERILSVMIARARSKTSLNNWMRVKILIIDEISMLSAILLDNLSLGNYEHFGGIKLLVFGDFLQLPPVSNLWHESTKWAFDSYVQKDLGIKTIELKGNNRHSGNVAFASMLKRLRDGSSTVDDFEYIKSLAREVLLAREVKYTDSMEPVRLYAKKNKVARYNSYRLSYLDAKSVILESVDTGDASMLRYCPVEEKIELKVGSRVMLVRNTKERLVNGSVRTLVGFETSPSGNTVPVVNMVLGNNSIV